MNSNSCPFSMDIQKHSAGVLVSCRRLDARCSMPPTSLEEMKMDFKSDRKSKLSKKNKIILYPVRNYDWCKRIVEEKLSVSLN